MTDVVISWHVMNRVKLQYFSLELTMSRAPSRQCGPVEAGKRTKEEEQGLSDDLQTTSSVSVLRRVYLPRASSQLVSVSLFLLKLLLRVRYLMIRFSNIDHVYHVIRYCDINDVFSLHSLISFSAKKPQKMQVEGTGCVVTLIQSGIGGNVAIHCKASYLLRTCPILLRCWALHGIKFKLLDIRKIGRMCYIAA